MRFRQLILPISIMLTSWIVHVPVVSSVLHCERVASPGLQFSSKLLTKDLLSMQTRSNMEITKLSIYVYCEELNIVKLSTACKASSSVGTSKSAQTMYQKVHFSWYLAAVLDIYYRYMN